MTKRVVLALLGTALPNFTHSPRRGFTRCESQTFNVTRRTSTHSLRTPESDGNGPATARVRRRHRTPPTCRRVAHNPGRSRTRAARPQVFGSRGGAFPDQLSEPREPSFAHDHVVASVIRHAPRETGTDQGGVDAQPVLGGVQAEGVAAGERLAGGGDPEPERGAAEEELRGGGGPGAGQTVQPTGVRRTHLELDAPFGPGFRLGT